MLCPLAAGPGAAAHRNQENYVTPLVPGGQLVKSPAVWGRVEDEHFMGILPI